jgi:SAM-dependent methyltransferase
MSSAKTNPTAVRHDWHSRSYVDEWIARDLQRDEERRQRLRQMLAFAGCRADAEIAVLDVGGGYGVVTEEVLRAFPRAVVTLQDYSEPMLARARQRLGQLRRQVRYAAGDLRDPSWIEPVGGPFDLIVSAIAIHNLRDLGHIAACYRAIAGLLKQGASFLDYDLFDLIGGIAAQTRMLEEAGFGIVDCVWQQPPLAIIAASDPHRAG